MHLYIYLPVILLSGGFLTTVFMQFTYVPYLLYFIILELITLTILGEEYKLSSCLLFNFFHPSNYCVSIKWNSVIYDMKL